MKVKLRIKILLAVFLGIVTIAGLYFFQNKLEQQRNLKHFLQETPERLVQDLYLEDFIADVTFVEEENGLHYKMELTEEYSNLSLYDQFGFFHLFCNQYKFKMLNTEKMGQLVYKNLYITGVYDDQKYEYEVIVPNKEVKALHDIDTLTVNQEQVYTEAQFLEEVEKRRARKEVEYINGFSDLEILKYAVRMYRLVTVAGKDIGELGQSLNLVTNAVLDKFGISLKEYTDIYIKYYLQVHSK